jgi:hypothetical protein
MMARARTTLFVSPSFEADQLAPSFEDEKTPPPCVPASSRRDPYSLTPEASERTLAFVRPLLTGTQRV